MISRRGLFFGAIVAAVVAADQVSKAVVRASLAVSETVPVIDGVLWLTHVENTGAAFGMLRGQQWLLIGAAAAMLAVVVYVMVRVRPIDPWARVALALVSGGAIGNLVDRVASGAVTDFFDLGWFPVFNIADIALDVGVAIFVLLLLFRGEHGLVGSPTPHVEDVADEPHDEEAHAADVQPTHA